MTQTNLASTSNSSRMRCVAALVLLLPLVACQSSDGDETVAIYAPIHASTFGEMRNVSVSGPVWFGGRPCEQDFELAKRRGIQRVIDLSVPTEGPTFDVAATCKSLQLKYLMAALNGEAEQSDDSVDLVLDWLDADEASPTLMFDGSGGRCATYFAIYRVVHLNVPLEEALVEARRAGMKPGAPEEFIRKQVKRLRYESQDSASN